MTNDYLSRVSEKGPSVFIESHLRREEKARAARDDRSLNEFVEDAVRAAVRSDRMIAPSTLPLTAFLRGRELGSGVNLDSAAALLEFVEDDLGCLRPMSMFPFTPWSDAGMALANGFLAR